MYWHMAKDDANPVIERGIALHKMIRLITFALGGEGWLNFMGNEFGHPEWLDFPREGNGWSFHHCRRQWSLVDNPELKYEWLNQFDRGMTALGQRLLGAPPARLLNLDPANKVLCAERGGLLLVFNFSVDRSIPGYEFPVPAGGRYQVVLDSDSPETGGQGRIDYSVTHEVSPDGKLALYTPARTAQVLAPIS
jgi:1,4-alpha-glucan branching enzyme